MVRDRKTIEQHNLEYDSNDTMLSYQWPVVELERTQLNLRFKLREKDRKLLAERFDVTAFNHISGMFEILQSAPNCWDITTSAEIEVTQNCVVSFEPVLSSFQFSETEQFQFIDENQQNEDGVSEEGYEMQPVEPIQNGHIPLGETVSQLIGVHLPLLPRSDTADEFLSNKGKDATFNPFHKLSELKKTE